MHLQEHLLRFAFSADSNLRSGVLFREKVRLIQFFNESSARSPECGLDSDWPKNNGALGALLRLVTDSCKSVNS